jgi:aspartate/methionine/tyrosine aminotransferase
MQNAMPAWLESRHAIQRQIRARLAENLGSLDRALVGCRIADRLQVEGGWYAVLRFPALTTGEEAAQQLLSQYGVVVHPGSFFGMPEQGWLVLSLLPPAGQFAEGIRLLLDGIYQLNR